MAEVSQTGGGSRKPAKIRRKKGAIRIDMTPMVDLAFLLLTFFMLTTTLLDPYVLPVQMPDKPEKITDPPPINHKKVITLVLGEKDKIYWYQGADQPKAAVTSYSSKGIRKILFEKKAQIKGLYVFIKPTGKSRYQNIVDILDEMIITDIDRFSLIKVTPEDLRLMEKASLQGL